jgi:MFS family permease
LTIGQLFFIQKYDSNILTATNQTSFFYFVSFIFGPVFGFIINRVGYSLFWLILGVFLAFLAHCIIAFTFMSPYLGLFIMGISVSLFGTSSDPLVPVAVKPDKLGAALGLMQSNLNLSTAIVTIVSTIIAKQRGYFTLELFFLGLSSCTC